MAKCEILPVHLGEILNEAFLKPMGITEYRLAKGINIQQTRISEIIHQKHGISADTALRLARFFGMTPEFWMNIQKSYELEVAKEELLDKINEEVEVLKPDH